MVDWWGTIWSYVQVNPVPAYAAVLSTISFLLALPLTIESYRKAKRERGLLLVEHASAGSVLQRGWRYETVILTLINVGSPTVSITGWEVLDFEGWLDTILGRPAHRHEGNGWVVPREATEFTLSLPDGKSPPVSMKSGEHMRLEIHAPYLWPDRARRKVIAVVRFSHSRKPIRIVIKPRDPWNFTDEKGLVDMAQQLPQRVSRKTEAGWQPIDQLGIKPPS